MKRASVGDFLDSNDIKKLKKHLYPFPATLENYFFTAISLHENEMIEKLKNHVNLPPSLCNYLFSNNNLHNKQIVIHHWLNLVKSIDTLESHGLDLQNKNIDYQHIIDAAASWQKRISEKINLNPGLYYNPSMNNIPFMTAINQEKTYAHAMEERGKEMREAYKKGEIIVSVATILKAKLISLEIGKSIEESQSNKTFYDVLYSRSATLMYHRNWTKIILANIGLYLAGLGIGYAIAGVAHLIKTRGKHFFFFTETQSRQKQLTIEKCAIKLLPQSHELKHRV